MARFHPVVVLPPGTPVLDLSHPAAFAAAPTWSIGRWDEDRGVYTQALFQGEGEPRTVHMGIDLGGPAGVAVHAFADGVVSHAGIEHEDGGYGGVLITRHVVDGASLWVLHGHLAHRSLEHSPVGRRLRAGDVLGWLGTEAENGGWPPHVHVQLCVERPAGIDVPGVFRRSERAAARARHPDPRRILGPLV
jgi:murein DD-endopeptidase MepM/ murein hydrolase activator NlpD